MEEDIEKKAPQDKKMKYLLDTDTCRYLMQADNDELMQHLANVSANQAAMSVVTQGELHFGIARKPGATRLKTRLEVLNRAVPTVDMPREAALHYAAIRAKLERIGTPLGANDIWIAAHALAADLTLVTNHTGEFSRVPKIRLENWMGK